jgi:hypothetical protein
VKLLTHPFIHLEMAYNPNDCVELRWGAPAKSDEASTCKRYAPAAQREKMSKYRAWFHERRRPPRASRDPRAAIPSDPARPPRPKPATQTPLPIAGRGETRLEAASVIASGGVLAATKPALSVLDRLETADVLNSAAYPFNKDAPTVADCRRNGLQSHNLATPIHERTLHSLQLVR